MNLYGLRGHTRQPCVTTLYDNYQQQSKGSSSTQGLHEPSRITMTSEVRRDTWRQMATTTRQDLRRAQEASRLRQHDGIRTTRTAAHATTNFGGLRGSNAAAQRCDLRGA